MENQENEEEIIVEKIPDFKKLEDILVVEIISFLSIQDLFFYSLSNKKNWLFIFSKKNDENIWSTQLSHILKREKGCFFKILVDNTKSYKEKTKFLKNHWNKVKKKQQLKINEKEKKLSEDNLVKKKMKKKMRMELKKERKRKKKKKGFLHLIVKILEGGKCI